MKKNLFLIAACVGMGMGMGMVGLPSKPAYAQEVGTMEYYHLTEYEYRNNYQAWRKFVDYHVFREPCQNYVAPPTGFVVKNCEVYRVGSNEIVKTTTHTELSQQFRTIYFDFDKSDIRESERQHVADIAEELRRRGVDDVVVMAHTDRAGDAVYNQRLSERRGHTVARALQNYGIRASFIEEQAFGESNPVDMHGDGVKSQENRRVVIKYKR